MDDSEEDLTKLLHQLGRRIPSLEIDSDVIKDQVKQFKSSEQSILTSMTGNPDKRSTTGDSEDIQVAKLLEEMKTLPSRVTERLTGFAEPFRRRKPRRFHPMMIENILHTAFPPGDPSAILIAASFMRDDLPWLYEVTMDVYRAIKTGKPAQIEYELRRLHSVSEIMANGPWIDEFEMFGKDIRMFAIEFPRMLDFLVTRILNEKRSNTRRVRSESNPAKPRK